MKFDVLGLSLALGTRIEVIWEDAHHAYETRASNVITNWNMGYFGGADEKGIRLWREIDEEGVFRFTMSVPIACIQEIRVLGGLPRGVKRPELQLEDV